VKREQLEHLIRAAGDVSGSRRLIVVGSQAILGQHPYDAPVRATLSREADLIPIDAPEAADAISGALGELSTFDESFGYHADGVGLDTATLPSGWRDRLVAIDNPNTNGYIGLCLELHDLLLSKYFAGRDKDHEFCRAVVQAGLVRREILRERLTQMTISASDCERIEQRIGGDFDN
jgi:hypothetical protein